MEWAVEPLIKTASHTGFYIMLTSNESNQIIPWDPAHGLVKVSVECECGLLAEWVEQGSTTHLQRLIILVLQQNKYDNLLEIFL